MANLAVRPATKDDLVAALGPTPRVVTSPKVLREAHHRVLRLIAFGLSYREVAERTGYSYNRVATLATAPASKAEIIRLRGDTEREMIKEYAESELTDINQRTLTFLTHQRYERIVEAYDSGEPIPIKDETAIMADLQDRFGTPRKSTNLNAYVNLAKSMEEAIARSEAAPRLVIDNTEPT